MNNISKKLYEMRIEKKWSQKKLAKKVMVSQSTICRVENDCNKIQWGIVEKIIKVLQKDEYGKLWDSFFKLNEEDFILFLDILNSNKKVKYFIDYNPKSAAKTVLEILEKKYFQNWK